ncbi:MAG TPA: ATP-dependent helicase, partial [Acidimicrobiales bacterium]|nr:ATP-dependent helicase [Acidimicrobiales bacterium]
MTVPGHPALGRGVVVAAGQAVPEAWVDAPTVVVDEAALAGTSDAVDRLRAAWVTRRPVVVRCALDPATFRAPPTWRGDVWALRPDHRLPAEELQFLVWANTYDARSGTPVWWWGRKAQRAGAAALADGAVGDVAVDGRPVWVDGGPRQPWPEPPGGLGVVHRESVERGALRVAPAWRPPAAELAADQMAAVTHDRGPARIIAPAGSGKTRVLTERVRHLLVDRAYDPDAVLAVAYNKRAQQELEARCAGLPVRARTLNSLGLWVCTEAAGRGPTVLAERDVRDVVRRLAPRPQLRANTDPYAPYLEALATVRLGLVDPEVVEAGRDDVPGLPRVFTGLRERFADTGALDFDDQVYGAVEALLADGELRARLQLRCRHLLVDEFQDLTPAHVLLIRLLAGPQADVFGVGDDDQVIYGHAGADPSFLIDFARLFPGAASHPLEVNYRCPPAVVGAAASLLSYNHRRVAKTITAGRPEAPDGPPGLTVRRHGAQDGATAVVEVVRGWLDGGAGPGEVAVLARVRAALLGPVVALRAAGVPVDSAVGPELLERTGVRAALAYLRLATGPERMAAADLVEVYR